MNPSSLSTDEKILRERLSREKNFALLNFSPQNTPVLLIGEKWESGLPASSFEKDVVIAVSYELKNQFEALSSRHVPSVPFPVASYLVANEKYQLQDLSLLFPVTTGEGKKIQAEARCSRDEYFLALESLLQHIHRGDIYEVNYCMEFFVRDIDVDPLHLFGELFSITQAPFSSFVRQDELFLLCGSPERFLRKEGVRLISQPIKGTIRRGRDADEDEILRNRLRNDPKEKSENVMIVDLVRNDLSRLASSGTVQVEELFGIYTFPTVHQMISTISCSLRPDLQLPEILAAAFPMGSMTGAPKIRAMELIDIHEHSARGMYSGTVGMLSQQGDFDLNVVIRSILYDRKNRYLSFSVGSAITAASDPQREYDECLLKAEAMIRAIGKVI